MLLSNKKLVLCIPRLTQYKLERALVVTTDIALYSQPQETQSR